MFAYRLVTDRFQGQARVQLMIEAHDTNRPNLHQ